MADLPSPPGVPLRWGQYVTWAALALGVTGTGGFMFSNKNIPEEQIAIIVREAMQPSSSEELVEFTHRVDRDHEFCIVDAIEQLDSSDKLLARIICDLSRDHEYSRRLAR